MSKFSGVKKWLGEVGTQVVVAVASALVLSAIVASHFLFSDGSDKKSSSSTATTTPAAAISTTTRPATESGATTTVPPQTTSTTPQTQGVRLASVQPISTEPCHTAGSADGSGWFVTSVPLGGTSHDGFVCNLFAGGTGSVDFLLSRSYNTLRLTLGVADDSEPTRAVKFEITSDDATYLAAPATLHVGETSNLVLDVHKTTRLRLRATDLGKPEGSGSAVRPVWADGDLQRGP